MCTHQYQYPHAGTRSCYVHTHIVHSVNNVPCTPSVFFRPCTCSCAICANVIASRRTCQVGGWRPCPPLHLVRPACTAPSSSRGWIVKQASIVSVRSPTPSRTALHFVAAFLLTYFLKSLRWSGWSAEKARHFTAHSPQVTELTNSPYTLWDNTGSLPLSPVEAPVCEISKGKHMWQGWVKWTHSTSGDCIQWQLKTIGRQWVLQGLTQLKVHC